MKCSSAWLALCAVAALGSAAGAKSGHPIEQVIELLKKLMVDVNTEAQKEEYEYGKFENWCGTSKKTLSGAIATEKETIDKLSDIISAKTEEIGVLTKQIATLGDELLELDKQDKKADELRTKENNLYKFTDDNLKLTIDGVKSALVTLTDAETNTDINTHHVLLAKAQTKVQAVLALVEVHTTAEQQSALASFATPADVKDLESLGDKDKHVTRYEFKSGKVVELLKQLVAKFEQDKLDLNKAETNAVNQYDLAKSARADEIAATSKSKGQKEDAEATAVSEKGEAETSRDSTQTDLNDDSQMLSDTEQNCATKEQQWADRSKMRALELEAMETAIKILSDVTGVRHEQPENPVPPTSPVAFLQISSKPGASKPDAETRALNLLRQAAKAAKSKSLERFAQEVSAHLGGPFDEVNNMMEKMIYRLMDEQKDEDEHKHWCDLEINKTDASLIDKEDKIEELNVKIEASKAKQQELQEDIVAAGEMVAKIEMHMKESAEIREVGAKENAAAIKDAQDAQTAIANAIAVLETHYKESGEVKKESWEFVQIKRHGRAPVDLPDSPMTWDSPYTGVTDPMEPDAGIIAVLQKTNADFAKMESATTIEEASDLKAYEQDMKDCEIEKATRLKESEVKESEKKRQVEKTATLMSEKKHVTEEKDVTAQYEADLQKACVEGGSTYDERKDARQEEIDALHKAKDILKAAFEEKTTFLLQRPKKALRRAA